EAAGGDLRHGATDQRRFPLELEPCEQNFLADQEVHVLGELAEKLTHGAIFSKARHGFLPYRSPLVGDAALDCRHEARGLREELHASRITGVLPALKSAQLAR